MGFQEGKVREQGTENPCEKMMTENIPNLVKETDIQAQDEPNKMNPKRPTPRHVIIKMPG